MLTTLYMTLVEPHFRYCDIVWGQCNETLKDKLQTLQNRAARVICNRQFEDVDDHQELLNHLGWLNVRQLFSLDLGVFVFSAISDSMKCTLKVIQFTLMAPGLPLLKLINHHHACPHCAASLHTQ